MLKIPIKCFSCLHLHCKLVTMQPIIYSNPDFHPPQEDEGLSLAEIWSKAAFLESYQSSIKDRYPTIMQRVANMIMSMRCGDLSNKTSKRIILRCSNEDDVEPLYDMMTADPRLIGIQVTKESTYSSDIKLEIKYKPSPRLENVNFGEIQRVTHEQQISSRTRTRLGFNILYI